MMTTNMGIALETWVNVDGDCPMTFEVSWSDAQLELGHGTGSLHLILTERGLVNLVGMATEALAAFRDVTAPVS